MPGLKNMQQEPESKTTTTKPARVTETQTKTEKIQVPNLSGTDMESAKTILVNSGLIPVVEEEFSDYHAPGIVTRTNPDAFSKVEHGDRVTVYVSRGLSKYYATNCQVSTSALNKVFKYDEVYVNVDSIYVENDVLHVFYQIGFNSYKNDYDGGNYYEPGLWTYYFRYSDFSVNIGGNLFNPTVYGEAAYSLVPRNSVHEETKFDSIHLEIPLNETVSHKPTQIDVTYTANIQWDWASGVSRGTSNEAFQNTFHIQNITW